MTSKTAAKPFASLNAALNALDVSDLCGDLELIRSEANATKSALIETATDALSTADSVETMSDLVANLQDAATALSTVSAASSVAKRIARVLARCAA